MSDINEPKDRIVQWIRSYFKENGPQCFAVVGISGGKDSSVTAALCAEALGHKRVFGVLMPQGDQPDIADSYALVEHLNIPHVEIDIGEPCAMLTRYVRHSLGTVSEQAKINLPARVRMTTLYAVAQSLPNGGRVANTCNLSEDYVGYSTKFGDSVGDFSPLAPLTAHEVVELGHVLGLPSRLVDKPPSDGLCGKTDEDNLGFTYAQLDAYLASGASGDPEVDKKIASLHAKNLHKLLPMPTPIRRPIMSPEHGPWSFF